MKNTIPWIIWLVLTTILLLSTRNPFYLLISLFALLVLGSKLALEKNRPNWFFQNIKFLTSMVALSTTINMVFAHTGQTIIFKLPSNWPLIGGNFTLESMIYGLVNGLVIGCLYLSFNIINHALSVQQITRLIPGIFHPISMIVTIAITFIPSIQQRTLEIKEAQIIRGNAMKNVSDWLPLIIPLLVTSFENAILLAESMTARGYHTRQNSLKAEVAIAGLILATFLVFSGWILQLYAYPILLSAIAYFAGGLILFLTLRMTGRHERTTRFHLEVWHKQDIYAVTGLTFITFWFLGSLFFGHLMFLRYNPYPMLTLPTFQLIGVFLSLAPLFPALLISYD